jgi:hypothetical protein
VGFEKTHVTGDAVSRLGGTSPREGKFLVISDPKSLLAFTHGCVPPVR